MTINAMLLVKPEDCIILEPVSLASFAIPTTTLSSLPRCLVKPPLCRCLAGRKNVLAAQKEHLRMRP